MAKAMKYTIIIEKKTQRKVVVEGTSHDDAEQTALDVHMLEDEEIAYVFEGEDDDE